MNAKHIVLLMLFLVLFSCKNSDKEDLYTILQQWVNREILFPNNIIFSIQGRDTVNYPIGDSFKILMYIDSTGCTSCRLKLSNWKRFMSEVDSLSNSQQVQFLFFFTPKRKDKMQHILSFNEFNHPICVDENDSINLLNHFSSNALYQTFLLDKKNKVLAMGNPIYSSKVKELYMNIISGKGTYLSSSEQKSTSISLLKNNVDFGQFPWHEEQANESCIICNKGNMPLVINDVITSCGCITVEYSKEPVLPGENLALRVNYKAEHSGHFNKTITIYCNAEGSPFRLNISGNAI